MILLVAFGAVDKPLASCMIIHFSAHILKWELVCKFGMMEWDFIYLLLFLALVHGFMHETSDYILLYKNVFIYQVLCIVTYCRCSLYSFLLPIHWKMYILYTDGNLRALRVKSGWLPPPNHKDPCITLWSYFPFYKLFLNMNSYISPSPPEVTDCNGMMHSENLFFLFTIWGVL